MGGGLAGSLLAATVSEAGGLGTIGILAADDLGDEIAAARRLTRRPVAVNLLLPFARREHFEAASHADVVVTDEVGMGDLMQAEVDRVDQERCRLFVVPGC